MTTDHGLRRINTQTTTSSLPHPAVTMSLMLLFLSDLAIAYADNEPGPKLGVALIVGSCALWALIAPQNDGLLSRRTARLAAAITSIAATITALATGTALITGPGEVTLLLLIVLTAVRSRRTRPALLCATALAALPYRLYYPTDSISPYFTASIVFIAVVLLTVVLGTYLRSLDDRRSDAEEYARRAERGAMAADLHDFVAHHVTGIAVQTQVARMLGTSDPARLAATLDAIETAAVEALESMRHNVGILRETDSAGATLVPTHDLAVIPDLIDRFCRTSPTSVVYLPFDGADTDLPHAVQAAIYRVVQESLTNIRKHAPTSAHATIALHRQSRSVRLTIDNDGPDHQPSTTTGYGLIGLTERVAALGGTLNAGNDPDAGGWRVDAVLPYDRADRPSITVSENGADTAP